jgi:hypothetical protein
VIKRLKQIYLSVDDIDLFTGGLREAAANLAILKWNNSSVKKPFI